MYFVNYVPVRFLGGFSLDVLQIYRYCSSICDLWFGLFLVSIFQFGSSDLA